MDEGFLTAASPDLSWLLSRMTWPSGMVRERACTSIAELLVDSRTRDNAQTTLLAWMRMQRLESVTAIGLLAFIKAKILDATFSLPPADELLTVVATPSILSDMLMEDLGYGTRPSWKAAHSGSALSSFVADTFFEKWIQHFLPPIYHFLAKEVETREHIPFLRQWSFEWHGLLEAIDQKPSRDALDSRGYHESDHYVTWDPVVSEVYRSAYLRVLAWAVDTGRLSDSKARMLAREACPVDLGLWRLQPSQRPDWWPIVDDTPGEIDITPALVLSKVEALWRSQRETNEEWIVAEASGVVRDGSTFYDLEICGLFQACDGPSRPDSADITYWYRGENPTQCSTRNLRFEGSIESNSFSSMMRRFAHWIVAPCACTSSHWPSSRWQHWRPARGTWVPAPFLAPQPVTFTCSRDSVQFREGEEVIARWFDWCDGLREKGVGDLPFSTGQCLLVRRQSVDITQARTGFVFCWVCKLTAYYREGNHQPFETVETYHTFGGTSVVNPRSWLDEVR